MALQVRPAHDPSKPYGFCGVVVDTTNLPPRLQGFGAVPSLVTDIDLSLDDKSLHVACWGMAKPGA